MPVTINGSGPLSGATTLNGLTIPTTGFGKLLQVVSATYSTEGTTTSTSFGDTGLTASITPVSTSSKVLALVFMPYRVFRTSATTTGDLRLNLVRGATQILETASYYVAGFAAASNPDSYGNAQLTFLDSPNTTSTTAYKVQYRVSSTGSATVMIGSSTSSIVLVEVGP